MIWNKKDLDEALVNDEFIIENLKRAREEFEEDLEEQVMKDTIKTYKELTNKYENKLNNLEKFSKVAINKHLTFYLDRQDNIFSDIDSMNEYHIDEYEGLDDGLSDWIYEYSEEISCEDALEMIKKGDANFES